MRGRAPALITARIDPTQRIEYVTVCGGEPPRIGRPLTVVTDVCFSSTLHRVAANHNRCWVIGGRAFPPTGEDHVKVPGLLSFR